MWRRLWKSELRLLCIGLTILSATAGRSQADETACPKCGCENGMRVVEVTRTICKMVPKEEAIKKTVYEKKEVPYCEHCLPKLGDLLHHQKICPKCAACGKTKTVLVKKSIECGKKTVLECVAEEVKEQVCMPCNQCGFCSRHPHLHKFSDAAQEVKADLASTPLPSPAPVSSRRTIQAQPVAVGKEVNN